MEDHKDITEVLTAVHAIEYVQPPIPEALIEEVATPTGPSTSKAPAGCQSCPLVATPRLVPTPDPSPSTPHPSPSPTIPSPSPHPAPRPTISSLTPHPSPRPTIPPPSLHLPHILVLGLTFVHPPHGHFLSCHPFHHFTWVLI